MKNMRRNFTLTAFASTFLTTMSSGAVGQESQMNLEEVLVTGVRGSIQRGLEQKRSSNGFVDAISAEELGKFPDLNLSESLQRIPGVTLSRNDFGDGSSINLRGLGSNFTRVEINGVTGTVNDARGGGFNFEILASELFTNASVKKSFNASDVEGGLAGSVELSTPRAFDRDGFNMTVSGQGQYAQQADDVGPRAAVVVSQNWDDVFGVTGSLAYSDTSFRTSSNGGISARPLSAPATDDLRASATTEQLNGLIPSTINYEVNNDQRETVGGTLGFQYRPSSNLEITFDGILARIEGDRRFTRADSPPENGIYSIEDDTVVNGVIRSATLSDVQNRVATNDNDTDEDFMQMSAFAEYTPDDNWTIRPFVGYSSRELSSDSSLLSFARGDLDTGQLLRYPVSYDVNGQFIEFSSPGQDLSNPDLAEEYFLNVFLIRPTVDKDEEVSTKIDFNRAFSSGPISSIDFGARYSSRETERSFIEVRVDNENPDTDLRTLPTLADQLVFEKFDINGAPSSFPSRIISANPDAVLDQYFLNGFNIDNFRSPVTGPLENVIIDDLTVPGSVLINRQARAAQESFSGEEETVAVYGEVTFEFDDLMFNAGVRVVDTKQTSSGFQVANDVGTPIQVSNSYTEALPSMSLRYELQSDLFLRGAYAKSLTRPTLNDLRVSESFGGIDESGGDGTRGNPELEPFTADNLDVGIEWYFAPEGLLAVNAFYKNIDGLIVNTSETEERQYLSQVSGELVTGPIVFSFPTNGDKATITGLEFIAQSRFDFLPEAFSDFGGIFNYTYTDSDSAFEEGQSTSETASIAGLSENSYNAILYYDNGRFDSRLSYTYREDFVESTAGSFGVPVFQNGRNQLDFSANYNVTDSLTFQFQTLNITEERLETESIRGLPHDTAQLGRRVFLGARYTF